MLTIFTPTYNRAYLLTRLYDSLCSQTDHSFEWLVVDDGSKDTTKDLIDRFIREKKINIRYFYQENSGKSAAYNFALKNAKGELFACVDSDDYLSKEAVENIFSVWEKAKNNSVGILCKKITPNGRPITLSRLLDGDFVKLKEIYHKGLLRGDAFLIFQTSAINKYFFPKFNNEKFVPEAYLFDQICEKSNLYYFDRFLYVAEYQSDGYTVNMNRLLAENPLGYKAYLDQRISSEGNVLRKFTYLVRYESICFVLNKGYIDKSPILFSLMAIFPGWLVYVRRFKKYVRTQ